MEEGRAACPRAPEWSEWSEWPEWPEWLIDGVEDSMYPYRKSSASLWCMESSMMSCVWRWLGDEGGSNNDNGKEEEDEDWWW